MMCFNKQNVYPLFPHAVVIFFSFNCFSIFIEILQKVHRRQDFNEILTTSSGNEAQLKVGITFRDGQNRWYPNVAKVNNEIETRKKYDLLGFKAEIYRSSSQVYLRVNVSCSTYSSGQQQFIANITNEIPHYPAR